MRVSSYRVYIISLVNLPEESDGRGSLDATVINIAGSTGDDASYDQAHDDADVLEEWGPKNLRQDDRNEGDESETDELWGSPPTGLLAADRDGVECRCTAWVLVRRY